MAGEAVSNALATAERKVLVLDSISSRSQSAVLPTNAPSPVPDMMFLIPWSASVAASWISFM
ncbi:hypothetical protein Kisp01_46760 [Kineosporia sp. NBRC 101677]|nr:hypothetical protein Kisp01_46760 [Kineosporia sp. NBRC 101677]